MTPTQAGTCPSQCVNSATCPEARDSGHEGDPCGSLTDAGTCVENVLLWCGAGPGGGGGAEVRWNFCPRQYDEEGNPKRCGFNPWAQVYDCIPEGCQSANVASGFCDTSRGGIYKWLRLQQRRSGREPWCRQILQ